MNKWKSSRLIQIFIRLFLFFCLIYSISHLGAYTLGKAVHAQITYGKETFIGNVDVSGLTEKDAAGKLIASIDKWKEQADIQFRYQEKIVKPSLDGVSFRIEKSIKEAESGKHNPLYAE